MLPVDHFEAAHAALDVHLLGSVQLEHLRHSTDGPSERAFSYGLGLILSGLRNETEGAA